MPQSLASILVHLTFSTKDRRPLIRPDIESELYPYLATVCREMDSPSLAINGTADHVHVANQKEHHRERTYQEELRLLLAKYHVEYDERYVWD